MAEISPLRRRKKPEHMGLDIPISQSQEPERHQFVKSIGDLAALSAAIDAFKRQYHDMLSHIELIQNAIDARLAAGGIRASSSSVSPPAIDTAGNEQPKESDVKVPESSEKPEAQRLCESMCSKGLRKYIFNNLADPVKIREEIPQALKLAQDPSKLVFESVGRFYLQGRRAFTKDSPLHRARKASLFVMECFLLMVDCNDAKTVVENSTKVEAEKAALAWRKRLMSEGDLVNAEPMDARGLLLLIACFGVPSSFRNLDLLDLVRQSKASEISDALRRSAFLVPMIPGIIDASINRGMHVDAVELVYTFGLEDKFSPPSILTSFLRMSNKTFEKAKQMAHSLTALKEANEKQLTALLSVIRCLETRNLDPVKVLGGWQIKEQMIELEKDIVELNKEIEEKERSIRFRMMEDVVLTERLHSQEMKRPRLSGMEMPMHLPSYSPPIHLDRSFPNRGDGDDISALVSSYLGSTSSFPHRLSSLRSSHENVAGRELGRGLSALEPHTGSLPSSVYAPSHGHGVSRQFSPIYKESRSLHHSPIGGQSLPGQQTSLGIGRVFKHSPSVERFAGVPSHFSHGSSLYK